MRSHHSTKTSQFLALAIGLALGGLVQANPVGQAKTGAVIYTDGDAPAYTVRVVYPDGRYSEQSVLAGEPVNVDPQSPGALMAEGEYSYEIIPILGVMNRSEQREPAAALKVPAVATVSGTFQVMGGNIQAPDSQTNATGDSDYGVRLKDIVNADDVIVQGSICTGFDCVNNESFGFDTIRLKENNVRIKFEDTSTGAFPSVDWQLTANDSASGGASYFGIDDVTNVRQIFRLTAGAPTNSMFVDSSGRLGLKTSTPVLDVHVATGNTPALRLEQNGSSGFTAQTWDIGANEANFFVRDVTNGSKLPFRVIPNAPSNSLYVNATGVGIRTASPDAPLHVLGASTGTTPAAHLSRGSAGGQPAWTVHDTMIVENSSSNNNVLQFLTAANKAAGMQFSTPTARSTALIAYVHSTDTMTFAGVSGTSISIPSTGIVSFPKGIASTTVNGDLTVTGTITPDYVFEDPFKVLSIEDHASFMWSNKHLPMLEPARTTSAGEGTFSLGLRSQQMLEELEYAHIYIDQLNSRLKDMERTQQALAAELRRLQKHVNDR